MSVREEGWRAPADGGGLRGRGGGPHVCYKRRVAHGRFHPLDESMWTSSSNLVVELGGKPMYT